MATYRKCNICKKELSISEDFKISHRIGYGSKHDGDKFEMDLCNECFDEFVDVVKRMCSINPITEEI